MCWEQVVEREARLWLGFLLWTWELTAASMWALPLDHMPLSWPFPLSFPIITCLTGVLLCGILLPARWQQDNPATHSFIMGTWVVMDSPSRLIYVLLQKGLLEMMLFPEKWLYWMSLYAVGGTLVMQSDTSSVSSPLYTSTQKSGQTLPKHPSFHSIPHSTTLGKLFLKEKRYIS